MASRALKRLGEKAFQSLKVGDIWHKPAISAKGLAKLRKQTLAEGRYQTDIGNDESVSSNLVHSVCVTFCSDWQFDKDLPARPAGFLRRVKGHKHDKLAAVRYVARSCKALRLRLGCNKQRLLDGLFLFVTGRKKSKRTWMACPRGYKSTGYDSVICCDFCTRMFAEAVPLARRWTILFIAFAGLSQAEGGIIVGSAFADTKAAQAQTV